MTIRTDIVVKFAFEGFHCWPDAPESRKFLRAVHRHMFHVRADKEVNHHNREIEIIALKNDMLCYCTERWHQAGSASCEMIAVDLLRKFKLSYCQVLEDDENGAAVQDEENEIIDEAVETSQKSRFNGSCFIGIECEGPERIRGRITMFIPGSVDQDEFREAMSYALKNKMNIYYGADNDFATLLNVRVVMLLDLQRDRWEKSLKTSYLIIEADNLSEHVGNIHCFTDCGVFWVTHNPKTILGGNVFYKQIVKNVDVIEWRGVESKHLTRTDDVVFKGDSVFQGAK